MAQDIEPSTQKQITFLIVFVAVVAALIFAVSFYLPQDAAKLAYIGCWVILIAGSFWLVERLVGALGKKK